MSSHCLLLNLPVDIFQGIVGFVDFRDIFHLLGTAKSLRTVFKETIYSDQLTCALEHEREAVAKIFWKTKEYPGTTWYLHDMLQAFVGQHCECGEYGYFLYWATLPPQRVCRACHYRTDLIGVQRGLDLFKLERKDIEGLPILPFPNSAEYDESWGIYTDEYISYRAMKAVAVRKYGGMTHQVRDHEHFISINVRDKGIWNVDPREDPILDEDYYPIGDNTDIFDEDYFNQHEYSEGHYYNWSHADDTRYFGHPDVDRWNDDNRHEEVDFRTSMERNSLAKAGKVFMDILDHRQNRAFSRILCTHCLKKPGTTNWIPRDYEFLRLHFAEKHPDALQTSEDGWAALPRAFQEGWLRSGMKTREFESQFRPSVPSKGFVSWALYMHRVFTKRARLQKQNRDRFLPYPKPVVPPIFQNTPNPYQMTGETLLDSLDHEGVLYGLPPVALSQQYLDVEGEDNVGQLKRLIAFSAIDRYLDCEKEKSLFRLREEINQQGPGAILSYFEENSIDWP